MHSQYHKMYSSFSIEFQKWMDMPSMDGKSHFPDDKEFN